MERLRSAILIPCYKRPEYTARCLRALEQAQRYPDATFLLVDDGSCDGTAALLLGADLPKEVVVRDGNLGLRATYLEFFDWVRAGRFDLLGVVGNDCLVPVRWLATFEERFLTTDADVLSPNVSPSNAAYAYSSPDTEGRGYRPAAMAGGLWVMRRRLLDGVAFQDVPVAGITGAANVIQRVVLEQEPRVGWLPELVVQDLGHWSGAHPEHIKTPAHRAYAAEVGRGIAW